MPRRDPRKEQYWRGLLRQWKQSGLTPREFCVARRIGQPSFYAWRNEIARRDQQAARRPPACVADRAGAAQALLRPTFVKLALDATTSTAIEIVLAGGRLLRVPAGFDADLLRQLLHLLEEPSC